MITKYKILKFLSMLKSSWKQVFYASDYTEEDNKRLVKDTTTIFMNLHPDVRFDIINKVISNTIIKSTNEIKRKEQELMSYKENLAKFKVDITQ